MNNKIINTINVVDNFLSHKEFEKICSVIPNSKWKIQVSMPQSKNEFLMLDVTEDKFFSETLNKKIQDHFSLSLNLDRVYFNGQWPGRDGDFHVDGCKKTALIYISDYNITWGGFTHLYNSQEDECIISPHKNRLVIFPGNIPHKGYSFANQNCPMRISLAFKLS
jgi:hypothetical protein